MNNSVFGKALETFRKHRDIKLVKQKRKELFGVRTKVSCYKVIHKNNDDKNEKKNKLMNKPVYLELSVFKTK